MNKSADYEWIKSLQRASGKSNSTIIALQSVRSIACLLIITLRSWSAVKCARFIVSIRTTQYIANARPWSAEHNYEVCMVHGKHKNYYLNSHNHQILSIPL